MDEFIEWEWKYQNINKKANILTKFKWIIYGYKNTLND